MIKCHDCRNKKIIFYLCHYKIFMSFLIDLRAQKTKINQMTVTKPKNELIEFNLLLRKVSLRMSDFLIL